MVTLFTLLAVLAAAVGFLEPVLALLALALENPQAVGALLGLLVPLLVSALKQPGLSPGRRRALAYVASGVVGILTVVSMGQFNLADLTSTLLVTIAVSQATYAELWKPTGVAAKVEKHTTPASRRPVEASTFAVVGEPDYRAGEVIYDWHQRVKAAGLVAAGEVSVRTSYESDPEGVIIAEGPVLPA